MSAKTTFYIGVVLGSVTPLAFGLAKALGGQDAVFLPVMASLFVSPIAALYLTWLLFKPMAAAERTATGALLLANILPAMFFCIQWLTLRS